jgi:hypothetical protein
MIKKKREAVRREFIEDGFNMGRCEDLTGGGLRRSAGGWEGVFELRRTKEYWRGDERILGDDKEELRRQSWSLNRIVDEVCRMLSVDPDDLHKKARANGLSSAKGLICYLGYYQLGINGKELARYFRISRPSVSQAISEVKNLKKRMMLNY